MVVSDTSGTWGCGAIHSNLRFQVKWPKTGMVFFLPPHWAGKNVKFLFDNMAVVAAVNKKISQSPASSPDTGTCSSSTAYLS